MIATKGVALTSLGLVAYLLVGLALLPRLMGRLRAGAADGCTCRWCTSAREEADRMYRLDGNPTFMILTAMLLVAGWPIDVVMLVAQRCTHLVRAIW